MIMSDDKDYKFINEKIVQKKMHPVKKFLIGLIAVLLLGAVFGVTERIIFEVTGEVLPHFNLFKKNHSIELRKNEEVVSGASIATESSVKEAKESKPETDKKQVKITHITFDLIPKPNQITRSGAIVIVGII